MVWFQVFFSFVINSFEQYDMRNTPQIEGHYRIYWMLNSIMLISDHLSQMHFNICRFFKVVLLTWNVNYYISNKQ